MERRQINNILANINRLGHFHFGDIPGRHEPGTGKINYRNVFKAVLDLGRRYQGYMAFEYGRIAPLEENLAAVRKLANFAGGSWAVHYELSTGLTTGLLLLTVNCGLSTAFMSRLGLEPRTLALKGQCSTA